MKRKSILAICIAALLTVSLFAIKDVKPKTTKYPVPSKPSAAIYLTEIYAAEYWTEIYLTYEENSNSYSEADAEKIIHEFISKYKVENKFSLVEVEDLKAASTGKTTTTVLKRLIFRQVRK